MLDYLLPLYGLIVTDRYQTPGGQRLWLTLTSETQALGKRCWLWTKADCAD